MPIARDTGHMVSGFRSLSVVVLHEAYGLRSSSSNVPEFCDRLAGVGYTASAPDLYRGASADTVDDALKLMDWLNEADALQMVQAEVYRLRAAGAAQVALLGFCMGGGLSFRSALELGGVASAVMFYATPRGDFARLNVPVLGHFALADRFVPVPAVRAAERELITAKKTVTFHYYDAEHSFMNEKLPAFSPTAAELAWSRTLRFLEAFDTS